MHSPLGEAIREARRSARLTQQQLGEHVGLRGRAVYRWERGDSIPKRLVRPRIVRAIEIYDPEAAATLATVFERQAASAKGWVQEAPKEVPAPAPKPTNPVGLELALFNAAEELDLAPRRLRGAIITLLERAAEAGYTLETTHSELSARNALQRPG